MVGYAVSNEGFPLASPVEPNRSGLIPTQILDPLWGGKYRGRENQSETDYRNELHGGCLLVIREAWDRPILTGFPREGSERVSAMPLRFPPRRSAEHLQAGTGARHRGCSFAIFVPVPSGDLALALRQEDGARFLASIERLEEGGWRASFRLRVPSDVFTQAGETEVFATELQATKWLHTQAAGRGFSSIEIKR